MMDYTDLDVWNVAMDLVSSIYRLTRQMPKDETYGLISQLRRASVSIPANVSEGYGRDHRAEYLRFLSIASGSKAELHTLLIVVSREYPDLDTSESEQLVARVGQMLYKLRASLRKKGTGL